MTIERFAKLPFTCSGCPPLITKRPILYSSDAIVSYTCMRLCCSKHLHRNYIFRLTSITGFLVYIITLRAHNSFPKNIITITTPVPPPRPYYYRMRGHAIRNTKFPIIIVHSYTLNGTNAGNSL